MSNDIDHLQHHNEISEVTDQGECAMLNLEERLCSLRYYADVGEPRQKCILDLRYITSHMVSIHQTLQFNCNNVIQC